MQFSNSLTKFEVYNLVIRRVFHCDAGRIFDAWTQPASLMRWWGPAGFTAPVCKIDLRVGGEYHCCTRSPQGVEFWTKGIFREIIRPKKIVATDSFCDAEGRIITPSSVGLSPSWPHTLLVIVTFAQRKDHTLVTIRHNGMPIQLARTCEEGWNETLDKLAGIL